MSNITMTFDHEGNCTNVDELNRAIKTKDCAIKYDDNKLRWHLMPFDALIQIQQVLDDGADKYGERNWEKGFNYQRLFSATMRHLLAWIRGVDNDLESGHPHLAHATANLLFLLAFQIRKTGVDDRGK